jgi:hypothetical protein
MFSHLHRIHSILGMIVCSRMYLRCLAECVAEDADKAREKLQLSCPVTLNEHGYAKEGRQGC